MISLKGYLGGGVMFPPLRIQFLLFGLRAFNELHVLHLCGVEDILLCNNMSAYTIVRFETQTK